MQTLLKFCALILFVGFMNSCTKDQTGTQGSEDGTIWDGPDITFTKTDNSDHNDEANQDRLTANVWITRASGGGQIFNIASESNASKQDSPSGTLWAEGTTQDIEALTLKSFRDGIGGKPKNNLIGKDLVLYLVEDDVYIDIRFTKWSQGGGGGFEYIRSTE